MSYITMSQHSNTQQPLSQQQPPQITLNQNSNLFELENQIILRFPVIKEDGQVKPHPATLKLREALQKVNQSVATTNADTDKPTTEQKDEIKDRLFIELNTETRKGKIKFDDDVFEARLVDLPCIIESLKTADKKTFFKTNDICQMLVCKTKDDPWSSSDDNDESKKKDTSKNTKKQTEQNGLNKKYLWPHGIAPPLKNVRRKRFRKVAKKKIIDYVEIEKEVKQLFRADREAVKVDYEVVLVDGELEDENLDEENKNSLNDDFDDSSQEDENNQMHMNAECSNTGYLDSIQDNLTSMNTLNQTTSTKVKKQIEESNMSSAMDDDESIMINSKLKSSTTKPTRYDELSNDNSNFATTSSKPVNKYFVEEVIGDLSSSDEDDDDDENKESENDESKLDASANVNQNEESNFEDFANESKDKTKNLDIHDANTMDGEAEDDDEDEDDKDNNKNNFPSSLSSSPTSNQSNANNKVELRNKLSQLEDDLKRIKEERRKREIEVNSINNPVLKKHLSSRLNNLIDDETKKTNEIEELKSLLNE